MAKSALDFGLNALKHPTFNLNFEPQTETKADPANSLTPEAKPTVALSPTKKAELAFEAWKTAPGPDTGAALFKEITPYIESSTRRHAGSTSPVLLGKARSLLVDALPRYDGRASLATFVDRQLQPLQRWSAKQRVGVKVTHPMVVQQRQLLETQADLEDKLGRFPSRAELADAMGLPISRIEALSKFNLPQVAEKGSDSEDGYSEASDQGVEDDRQLWLKAVYYGLNPVNQYIMEHTTGLNGAQVFSNMEIAKKLKLSPGAVSQRKAKIQRMIDEGD